MTAPKFQSSSEGPLLQRRGQIAKRGSRVPARMRLALAMVFAGTGLLFVTMTNAGAQSYSIDWFTIDDGGGTSTGGVYSVSGTIGQLDAGAPMTNGQYSVIGGFWVLPTAVQTVGAPTLRIMPDAPGQVTISWSPATPGFMLQESVSLSPANWINSTSGGQNPAVVPAAVATQFYRLVKSGF